ncbi:MAG: cytochrome oxidase subunit periplasmic domain protein [Herminiimonas sp.]|nr:cytochrome oxidase subunit periplasmic domain protein [Herminiimonas sp.]
MSVNHKRRLLLIAAAAGGLSTLAAIVVAQPQERIIKVVAKKFDFTPGEIHLKRSVPVVLELTTLDVVMGFNAPDFGVRSDIMPGAVSRVRFTPDKVGEFPFHCDIFCGSGHESMSGVIAVT